MSYGLLDTALERIHSLWRSLAPDKVVGNFCVDVMHYCTRVP